MSIRNEIISCFHEVLEQTDSELQCEELADDTILLESGLDSLGFAILVSLLDEKLGIDPFTMTDEVVYPQTFGAFVSMYENVN